MKTTFIKRTMTGNASPRAFILAAQSVVFLPLLRLMAAALALLSLPPVLRGSETVVRTGHFDLGIDYVPGEGWTSYIWDFAAQTRLPAHEVILHLGESTRQTVPDGADFAFLGPAGNPVWILPEIYDAERLYLGVGARQLGRDIFTGGLSNRGRVTMRLLSVEGTGPQKGGNMVLWQAAFPPQVHFSTTDGIGPEDALEAITANFHAHYNFAFTEPGLYRARFEFSGTLLPEHGGGETSTEAVYTFEVLHADDSGPLRYAWDLGNGRKWSSWLGSFTAETERWIYADRLGWMYFPAGGPDSFWLYRPGRGWLWSGQSFFPWAWSPRESTWTYLHHPTNS